MISARRWTCVIAIMMAAIGCPAAVRAESPESVPVEPANGAAPRTQAEPNPPPHAEPAEPAPEKPASQPVAAMSLIPTLPEYGGDIWHRSYLTGDWGGARTDLAQHGILFDLDVTQYLQNVAHAGKSTNGATEYGGMVDYRLRLDTDRAKLWPGGLIILHGQTQFGTAVNKDTGSLMTPNFEMLLPLPGDPGLTTLSEYYIMQALSKQVVLVAGKVDLMAFADRNAFAGDVTHETSFMNTAFNVNPILSAAGPYTALTAGVILIPTDWLQVATVVLDNDKDGAATTTGFNTAFHSPAQTSVAQEFDFTLKLFSQTGHQRIGWFYTNKETSLFQGDSRIQIPVSVFNVPFVPGRRLPKLLRRIRTGNTVYEARNADTRPDNYGMYYNFDQYLFTEHDDPTQGWGLFGRFGMAPSNANFIDQFYSIGLGGKGTIPRRDHDTWGAGYYCATTSNDIRSSLGLSSEQGVELFYNIEVTPWFHLTPDIQVVANPGAGFRDRDTAVVFGLRGQINF